MTFPVRQQVTVRIDETWFTVFSRYRAVGALLSGRHSRPARAHGFLGRHHFHEAVHFVLALRYWNGKAGGGRLTPQAEILVARTKKALRELERAEAEIAASLREVSETIRVAALQTAMLALMPVALTLLRENRPWIWVEASQAEPDTSLPDLLTRDFDLMIDEGVFTGNALRGVPVSGSWAGFEDLGRADLVSLPGRGHHLAGMIAAEPGAAVVQEDLHVAKVPETGTDAFAACGGRVVHPPWPQGVGPQRAALMVGDDGGLHRVQFLLARDERTAPRHGRPGAGEPGPRWRPQRRWGLRPSGWSRARPVPLCSARGYVAGRGSRLS